jgi:hypothetical protein
MRRTTSMDLQSGVICDSAARGHLRNHPRLPQIVYATRSNQCGIVIGITVCLWAQAPSATSEKSSLAGKVLNSVTGEPIYKAHVALLALSEKAQGGSHHGFSGALRNHQSRARQFLAGSGTGRLCRAPSRWQGEGAARNARVRRREERRGGALGSARCVHRAHLG